MSGLVDTTTHNENHLDCFFNPTSFGWVEKAIEMIFIMVVVSTRPDIDHLSL